MCMSQLNDFIEKEEDEEKGKKRKWFAILSFFLQFGLSHMHMYVYSYV